MAAPIERRLMRRVPIRYVIQPGGYVGELRDEDAHQEIEKIKEIIDHGGSSGTGGIASLSASGGHVTNGANAPSYSGQGYNCSGGSGQGTTTKEFGEEDGDLYADGGGHDTLATPNSGNGANDVDGGGCSGIVIVRNHRE